MRVSPLRVNLRREKGTKEITENALRAFRFNNACPRCRLKMRNRCIALLREEREKGRVRVRKRKERLSLDLTRGISRARVLISRVCLGARVWVGVSRIMRECTHVRTCIYVCAHMHIRTHARTHICCMFHAHWFPFHMNFAWPGLVLVWNRTYVILT